MGVQSDNNGNQELVLRTQNCQFLRLQMWSTTNRYLRDVGSTNKSPKYINRTIILATFERVLL